MASAFITGPRFVPMRSVPSHAGHDAIETETHFIEPAGAGLAPKIPSRLARGNLRTHTWHISGSCSPLSRITHVCGARAREIDDEFDAWKMFLAPPLVLHEPTVLAAPATERPEPGHGWSSSDAPCRGRHRNHRIDTDSADCLGRLRSSISLVSSPQMPSASVSRLLFRGGGD